jgi:hypothetical protein
MAKIRHLAFFADSPEEMAKFYVNAFGFEITGRGVASVWLTDGYLDIALLKRAGITLEADEQPGVYERLNRWATRPSSRRATAPMSRTIAWMSSATSSTSRPRA